MAKAKRCVPCIGGEIKVAIMEANPSLAPLLERIEECDEDREMVVCGKGTRPLSAYQQFVKDCMKGKELKGFDPAAMKDCASRWRAQKGK